VALLVTDLDGTLRLRHGGPEPAADDRRRPYHDLFYRAMAATAGALLIWAWPGARGVEVWVIVLGAFRSRLTEPGRGLPMLEDASGAAVGVTFLAVSAAVTVLLMVLIPRSSSRARNSPPACRSTSTTQAHDQAARPPPVLPRRATS
jgi:hypothetical protein